MTRSAKTPVAAAPRAAMRAPAVLIPASAAVLALLGYGVWQWREMTAASDARARLLADVEVTLQKGQADGSELSRLMAMLHKFADHATARDLLAAQARIELARGRAERARELFGALGSQPGASPPEQGLAAQILLQLHAAGAADRAAANGLLEQAVQLAAAASTASQRADDLLLLWQAAERLGRHDRAADAARDLAANHAESPANAFVQFATSFAPTASLAALEAAEVGLRPKPVEGEAMRVFLLLQSGDLPGAAAAAERGLGLAPGVTVVRWAGAVVFHACVLGSAADSPDRLRWTERRDAQLAWLLEQGNIDDARAQQIRAMREQR